MLSELLYIYFVGRTSAFQTKPVVSVSLAWPKEQLNVRGPIEEQCSNLLHSVPIFLALRRADSCQNAQSYPAYVARTQARTPTCADGRDDESASSTAART